MVLAPIQFSGQSLGSRIGAGVQQGQQIAQGQNILEQQRLGIEQQRQQAQLAEAQRIEAEEQQALASDLLARRARGESIQTGADIARLPQKLFDQVFKSAGAIEDFQKQELAEFGFNLEQLQGDPAAQQQLIEQRVLKLQGEGRNFRDTGLLLQQTPEQRQRFARVVQIGALNEKERLELSEPQKPEALQAVTPAEGGGFVGIDPTTRQSVFVPAPAGTRTEKQVADERKAQEQRVEQEVKDEKTQFDKAQKLRAEITKASTEFDKLNSAFGRIEASVKSPSPAGDIALIFNFMKMLDPGSVVREGEFATAAQAAGVPTRILNQYNKLVEGERLAPKQRTDFLNQSKNIFERAQEDNVKAVNKIVDIGDQFGVSRSQLLGREPEQTGRRLEDLTTADLANLSDEELQALSQGAQ